MRKVAFFTIAALAVAGYLGADWFLEARRLVPLKEVVLAQRADLKRNQASSIPTPEVKPNMVVIIADDLGWGDVGYNGSEIATPVMDDLAAEGLKLTRFYSHPSCTPTRAALLTGKSPMRLGISNPLSKNNPTGLPLAEETLAQHLSAVGYQTALLGKWHLGARNLNYHPNARGFDYFYGHLTGGVGYRDKVHGGGYDWQRNGATVRDDGYATHLIAQEAVAWVESRNPDQPFFLYAAFAAPHLPNEAPDQTVDAQSHIRDKHRKVHAAMVSELDTAIGQIRDALTAEGIADNTLIWFLSDNGGLIAEHPLRKIPDPFLSWAIEGRLDVEVTPTFAQFIRTNLNEGGADNGPFKGGKQTVNEGGVRVPSFLHWPGNFAPAEYRYMATVQDIAPTLLEIARAGGGPFDGRSLWTPFQTDTPGMAMDYIIQTNAGGEHNALYRFPYKLIERGEDLSLFDLHRDPFEAHDLARENAELVAELLRALQEFPRGDNIGIDLQKVVDDPDYFGGTEDLLPWAEQAYHPD